MNLRIRSLRAFGVLARIHNYTLAAQALGLTQSALSKQVKELEAQVGVRLVDRTTRTVTLTPEGHEFLADIDLLLEQFDRSLRHIRGMAAGRTGRLRVAAPPNISATWLPPALSAFMRANPDVEITCHDCSSADIVLRLMAEDAEVAVTTLLPGESPPPGLTFAPLLVRTDYLSAAFIPGHPLERARRVTWDMLRVHTLVQLRPGATALRSFEAVAARHRATLPVHFEVSFINTALGMAAAGVGVVVLPHDAVAAAADHRLVCRRIEGTAIQRRLGLLHLANRNLSGPARAFAAHLRRHLRTGKTSTQANIL